MLSTSESVSSLIEASSKVIPELNRQMLANKELLSGLSEEQEQKWLALTDESMHAVRTMQRRRTMSEKRGSVLQDNRFPTAASKFHQAKYEQAAYVGMCIWICLFH